MRLLSSKINWELMNPILASSVNPMLANPLNYSSILTNVTLSVGENIINHGLGRTMLGWFLTDIQGAASIYRSQPFNKTTLVLTSDAAVTCSIAVF